MDSDCPTSWAISIAGTGLRCPLRWRRGKGHAIDNGMLGSQPRIGEGSKSSEARSRFEIKCTCFKTRIAVKGTQMAKGVRNCKPNKGKTCWNCSGNHPGRAKQTQIYTTHQKFELWMFQGPLKGGGSKEGGSFPIWTRPSLFVLCCPSWDFWDFHDFSGDIPDLSFSTFSVLLRGLARNIPERVWDTIRTFPEEKWEHSQIWNPPGLPSLKG